LQDRFGFHNIALNTGDVMVDGSCGLKVWAKKVSYGPNEIYQHI
jgi:hypothetical protein